MKKIGFRISLLKPYSKIPVILLFSLFSLVVQGAVITVPGDYSSIQAAINAANDGDEIIVSPGNYAENINFGGKNIILRSTDPTNPSIVASTIIDGNSAGAVVTFSGTELNTCVLSGFTITNGYALRGGGIYGNDTLATIQNSNITTNTSFGSFPHGYGGGLYKCNGIIKNNIISGNSAFSDGWGGGGGLYSCYGTIQNNIISANSAQYGGGGLSQCDGTIQNNIISGNSAQWGGGLYNCGGIIQNNTVYGNSADWGGGFYDCRGFIINSIVWANSASRASSPSDRENQLYGCNTPFYSCIEDLTSVGRGNISSDPRFVDPSNRDYHLLPDSPCIDAGNKYYLYGNYISDIDGECRLAGSSVDIGSDEYNSSLDSDADLLADADEIIIGSDPNNPDTDGDGLKDGVELLRGTSTTIFNIPSGISIPGQYSSIQQGLFLAFPSEIITVSPGTFYENIYFGGKNVILRSINPHDDNIIRSTIINGNQAGPVITFSGTENEISIVTGFTITYGAAASGGGIKGNSALTVIQNNIISRNFAYYGGGLYHCNGFIMYNSISDNSASQDGGGLYNCDGTIQNNTISSNWGDGAGLCKCDGTIQNNTISGNSAEYGGGGLFLCGGTIQNNTISGNSAEYGGGGLFLCSGTIQNNTISSNRAYDNGGGLYECNGTIQNNIISGNSAYYGGGLCLCYGIIHNNTISGNSASGVYGYGVASGSGGGLSWCYATIQNNTISSNWAYDNGGGLYNCQGTIQNNIISNNRATGFRGYYGNGGGLYNCDATIQNNTISSNRAYDNGGGLYWCNGTIKNCIIWENVAPFGAQLDNCSTPSYSCMQDWTGGGTGNISSNPQLVDPSNEDFHLQSSSPCIDAGGNVIGLTQDFEGDSRPYDGTSELRGDGSDYDIGADEYVAPMPGVKDWDLYGI